MQRNLPNDISRCVGEGCEIRDQCRRHRQIAQDQRRSSEGFYGHVSYVSTLREGLGPCEAFIQFEG